MKNHAFMFLVHNQPKLLLRTLKILESPNHHFFIHIDAKCDIQPFVDTLRDIKNVTFLQHREKVYHSGITMIKAEIKLLEFIQSTKVKYDYYHLLSGQDYPLRSNQQFDDFFETTSDSFMCYNFDSEKKFFIRNDSICVNSWHPNRTSTFWAKWYIRLRVPKLLWYFRLRKPMKEIYSGWQWFSWSSMVVNYVLNEIHTHPEFLKRFEHTQSADEHVFHTLLNDKLKELNICKHYPLRYVSWHTPHREVGTNYRPYTLNELDYERVINSAAFFCRKVSEKESYKLLDMIDKQRENVYDINTCKYFD